MLGFSAHFSSLLKLILVGFLWGVTNPFIKRGTEGVNNIQDDNRIRKSIKEIIFLVTSWEFLVPFLANQCGSLLYYFSLKDSGLTLAVPVSNSTAFVCTAVAGWCLGEEVPDKTTKLGMVMIAFGIGCYLMV